MTRRARWLACTALTVAAGPMIAGPVARAADWDGSTSTNWFDSANWSTNAVPTVADAVKIDTVTPNATVITGGFSGTAQSVAIANGVGSTGQLSVTNALADLTTPGTFVLGVQGSGTLLVTGGAVLIGNAPATDQFTLGAASGSTGVATVTGSTAVMGVGGNVVVGSAGTATLTVQNGGTLNAAAITLANAAGSTGTLNIGAATGAAAAAPGAVNAPTVAFGAGTGRIVFNHTASSYAFAPLISGAGTVLVEAGTTSLTSANTYTGNTTVNGGTLLVNGSIASSALTAVNAGGTLGGSGTVGNTAINGGTLSPGKPKTALLRMKVSPNLYAYLEILARDTQLGAGPNDVASYLLTQRLEQMLDGKYHEKKIPT